MQGAGAYYMHIFIIKNLMLVDEVNFNICMYFENFLKLPWVTKISSKFPTKKPLAPL